MTTNANAQRTAAAADANRLRSTMGLMARDNDNEAIVALRHATRMLKDLGLDWSDVADLALRAKPANDTVTPSRAQANSYAQPQPQPQPQPRPQPRPEAKPQRTRVVIDGRTIPSRIIGQIVMQTIERTSKGSHMTVFFVAQGDTLYGPIVAYTDARVTRVFILANKRAEVEVRMKTPGEGRQTKNGYMPQAGDFRELS